MPRPVAVSRMPKMVATLFGKALAVTAKLAVELAVQPMASRIRRRKQRTRKTVLSPVEPST